ncbi:hypothetical protein LV564_07470 [Komagataeibacter nataicola]|uniref:hypothetical protein n=1 Tax=Komagataeibacter nataicola TaxID=265960 RepID=UPI0023DD430F|nr:hypothetical protein [Komagataeibacter nataicola]WEQ56892.1 hypothetical protein LV564_07470 [Komagataeibacter nataicola]
MGGRRAAFQHGTGLGKLALTQQAERIGKHGIGGGGHAGGFFVHATLPRAARGSWHAAGQALALCWPACAAWKKEKGMGGRFL